MAERYNITVPRKYKVGDEERTAWDNIGVMFKRDGGGYSITLTMFPDLKIMVFPPKDDREKPAKQADPARIPDDDIPF